MRLLQIYESIEGWGNTETTKGLPERWCHFPRHSGAVEVEVVDKYSNGNMVLYNIYIYIHVWDMYGLVWVYVYMSLYTSTVYLCILSPCFSPSRFIWQYQFRKVPENSYISWDTIFWFVGLKPLVVCDGGPHTSLLGVARTKWSTQ